MIMSAYPDSRPKRKLAPQKIFFCTQGVKKAAKTRTPITMTVRFVATIPTA